MSMFLLFLSRYRDSVIHSACVPDHRIKIALSNFFNVITL